MSVIWIIVVLFIGVFACFVIRKTPDTALTPSQKAWGQWIVWLLILVYFLLCFFGPFPDLRIPGRRG